MGKGENHRLSSLLIILFSNLLLLQPPSHFLHIFLSNSPFLIFCLFLFLPFTAFITLSVLISLFLSNYSQYFFLISPSHFLFLLNLILFVFVSFHLCVSFSYSISFFLYICLPLFFYEINPLNILYCIFI